MDERTFTAQEVQKLKNIFVDEPEVYCIRTRDGMNAVQLSYGTIWPIFANN